MNFVWHWPQIVWLCLVSVNLFGSMLMDGSPKKGNYSAGITAICIVLGFGLLYFGGFFTEIRP